jgi:DMSO reductase iron-sulfur subunit
MTLPLLQRARTGEDITFLYTPRKPQTGPDTSGLLQIRTGGLELIPERALQPGEQYRFHFDMTKCIGCKCCVVACNEQNGNPAGQNWRRVGEVEGGVFPDAQRFFLSMGCNHCLEPSCMKGCPVEAYTKDESTGVVLHSADMCIGCQYCTWNCSYGVPQYNPERGVVGKCDMCHNRISDGMAPACVSACPEGAIRIEIVNTAEWRADHGAADAPGLPSAADSLSTTRVTLPEKLSSGLDRVDTQRVSLEDPHYPLVFMLVLTQLAVGAFLCLWLLDMRGAANLTVSAVALLTVAGLSLGASTLHLGRPIYAFRAIRGWKRSWLSREVLTLSAFAGAASAYAGLLMIDGPMRPAAGLMTALFGFAGVASSARIYVVRARPAWDSWTTPAEFFGTALLLGPLFVRAMGLSGDGWLPALAVGGAAIQLMTQALKLLRMAASEQYELRASAQLLSGRLRRTFLLRLGLLVLGGLLLPLSNDSRLAAAFALSAALTGELLGRWLFFVGVVPKNIAASFTAPRRNAA